MKFVLFSLGVLVIVGVLTWLVLRGGDEDEGKSSKSRGRSPGPSRSAAAGPSGGGAHGGDWTSASAGSSARDAASSDISVDMEPGIDGGSLGDDLNWIVCEKGEHEGKAFHMGERNVQIGREPASFIQLGDSSVSRTHAELRADDDGVVLVDKDSTEGTVVGGETLPAGEPRRLADGETFEIEGNVFKYVEEGDFRDAAQRQIKETGEPYESRTAQINGREKLEEAMRSALDDADGDVRKAASEMNMEPEAFEQMLDVADIDLD